mmetsp:Transcript_34039/g.67632  ORF Transcript_34039/g.67632 Transcript_34039/m.67632 type:complete len:179 (-) Transcript_34039:55-591(-)|eukprot:CAMPEP_0170408452 /NCGR_PEP_ID=MMETSP0117_2-20130122/28800_1 /TAXON_ID=400756 /ORGANISM="Durinskia baltica, Strain CSIRO CS-38" /LENGTH=178 /DNA_ID=CAMNT_0010665791 /DNA_START=45 /DNA_END=581 /DNA_ORIENTATION=+
MFSPEVVDMEFLIERNPATEWRRFRTARLEALGDAPDSFGRTLADEEEKPDSMWIDRSQDVNVAQFVALRKEDGKCIGIVVGSPISKQDGIAGLFSMWVAPEARGMKVGHALVEKVKDWAIEERIFTKILLDVNDLNVAAIKLYKNCGFIPTGKIGSMPPPREYISEHELCYTIVPEL